jgi:hypothetical protein
MAKIFWTVWLLVLVVWSWVFTRLLDQVSNIVINVNQFVVAFVPSELLFVFIMLWFGLWFRVYQAVKS